MGGAGGAPVAPRPGAAILFSEIMYHPVAENAAEDRHEFLELANRTAAPVSIAGWKLQGGVTFTFAPGTTIGPQKFLVVAKNRDALLAVRKYALAPSDVVGPYAGELDNGGGNVQLVDDKGGVVDVVAWRDNFPWPLAADAFGGGEEWLKPPHVPLMSHQYMGCSLERLSFDVPATEVSNWDASDIDGATPGRPNPRAGDPPPIVEAHGATPESGMGPIRADAKVVVRARFSARGTVTNVQLKTFVDVLDRSDEPAAMERMAPGPQGFEVTLPARPSNTLVRYQIWADRGKGLVQVSPRPSDPYAWHSYFVSPTVDSRARVYHLLIDPAKWQQMYTNVVPDGGTSPRRVLADRCTVNPSWNARVPATFVFDGKVYDVQVRYGGSNYNRIRGLAHPGFSAPRPRDPNPFRVLGLKVKFPKWNDFEGDRRGIKLNKLNQSCPGINEWVGGALFRAAGIPASNVRWARVHINGAYYHYMMEIEEQHEEFIKRNGPKGAAMGDLYKADGVGGGNDGPFARSDFAPIADNATCGIKASDRYRWNYSRKTNDWKTDHEAQALIEGLAAARTAGAAALRTFLERTFDVAQVITYLAVRNWSGPWDDGYHNFMLYKRPDGKWTVIPLDHDLEFGVGAGYTMVPATASFYIGEVGDPNNLRSGVHQLKDAFLKTFRAEFNRKLLELDQTLLAPANVTRIVNEGAAAFSLDDWRASGAARPDQTNCADPNTTFEAIRQWSRARHDHLLRTIR
jgi:hypothetical protein